MSKHPNAKWLAKCEFATLVHQNGKMVKEIVVGNWEYESHSLYDLCDEINAYARQEEISAGRPVFPHDVMIRELK
jgi:hypothetical protein